MWQTAPGEDTAERQRPRMEEGELNPGAAASCALAGV